MRFPILLLSFLFSFNSLYSQNLSDLSFGTDSTFDVISWNMEWFPTNGQSTIDSMITAIKALDADVIAVQEIYDGWDFQDMLDSLEGYDGKFIYSDYLELGYIYKTSGFEVDSIYYIFTNSIYSREFPRRPMVMELTYNGEEIIIINNHLKCCGDGILDLEDEWDQETRRYDACNLLSQFIEVFHPDDKVIITGDMNDLIEEDMENNVFEVFINDSINYDIIDMDIALGPTSYWSYPTWPSHLDHFIITNELFEEYEDENSYIETLRIEDFLEGGFNEYENNMSDHRPIALKLSINPLYLEVDEFQNNDSKISIYPNPTNGLINIEFGMESEIIQIDIYNLNGQVISTINELNGFSNIQWDTWNFSEGLYFIKFINRSGKGQVKKLIIYK